MPLRVAYTAWKRTPVFSQNEIRAAFAALDNQDDACRLPWPCAAVLPTPPSSAHLLRFTSHRGGAHQKDHAREEEDGATMRPVRDHIEVPLCLVLAASPNVSLAGFAPHGHAPGPAVSAAAASCSSSASVRDALPKAVQFILDGLYDANVQFVDAQLTHPSISASARRDIWEDLSRKSVLRLLRYTPGTACRPHVDPGLATALLMGSADGLEVLEENSDAEGTSSAPMAVVADHHGDYGAISEMHFPCCGSKHSDDDVARCASRRWRAASSIPLSAPPPQPTAVTSTRPTVAPAHGGPSHESLAGADGSALLLRGRMLQVLSRGALPGAVHRVTDDWKATGADGSTRARYNIVVELRPAVPKKWYALAAT